METSGFRISNLSGCHTSLPFAVVGKMAGVFRQEHDRDLAKVWIGAGEIISRSRSDLDRDLLIQQFV